jgi:hypothetical protein
MTKFNNGSFEQYVLIYYCELFFQPHVEFCLIMLRFETRGYWIAEREL